MCVLTFYSQSKEGFIITNNRDENLARISAILPERYMVENTEIYFPKDQKSGGTWIATNPQFTLCLLNGATERHISKDYYNKSRGQIILDFYKNKNFHFLENNEYLADFENFTLIIIENLNSKISELVWDSNRFTINQLTWHEPKIWSSCTLYTNEVIQLRKEAFQQFLKRNKSAEASQLMQFHMETNIGTDSANNLVKKRNDGTFTQAICQVNFKNNLNHNMYYFDLILNQQKNLIIR